LISWDQFAHVCGRVFIQLLVVVSKDEDSDVDRAENGQLVSLLEQATLSLEKSAGVAR
jgi:hypothetical protein